MQKLSNSIAIFILSGMLLLLVSSSWNDSATFDEVAHIPSGYTALKYHDSRLNPEHPPLIKDLSAFPLLFLNLNFELRSDFWQNPSVNDRQWQAGHALLYEFNNDPDKILFASRLPIIFLSIFFGWLLYGWAKSQYGFRVGLLSLFFYSVSPTVLAHSRYVTTDIGAAFGFFLGIVFFLKFLGRPDWKRTIWLGLILGMVLMFKFSLILLLPVFGILYFLAYWIKKTDLSVLGKLIFAGLIAICVIWVVYAYHTWNYPIEQNLADAETMLVGYKVPFVAPADIWLIKHQFTRPLGQYLFGFLMTARRTAGGNTAYFLGEVSAKGWRYYFPVIYLTKEQLAFHFFTLLAVALAIIKIKRGFISTESVKRWIGENFPVMAGMVFIAVYWVTSIANPLNIGVRHVLPTFPFIYFLVSMQIVIWMRPISFVTPNTFFGWFKSFNESYLRPAPKYFFIIIVFLFMIVNILKIFPHYLAFYNILGGGSQNGYKIATDSNYDWGQDLKRLVYWKENNHIKKIYLDYFGGGDPGYYLGKSNEGYEFWWSAKGPPPAGSYFAVSLNSLAGNQAQYNCTPNQPACSDATIKPEDTYSWLKNKTPVARGGMSILIFKID